MPKERSHWFLAQRLAGRFSSGPLADALLGYFEYLLLGSVAHDSPYYVLGDPGAKRVADRLHGTGRHDSFAPFRALASHRDSLGAAGLAFGLGALTHLAADVTFHPLVFSWTGDAGADDPELSHGWFYRHQACETALDLHFESLWGPPPARTYGSLARKAGGELTAVYRAFAGHDPRSWISAHRRLQGLFHHPVAGWLAQALAWGHPGGEGDHSGAFYAGPAVRHPAFEGTMEWVDPVTGAPGRASLEELVLRYEEFAYDLAVEWERAWTSGTEPFAGAVGPALDTGLPCDRDQTKRHFLARWF